MTVKMERKLDRLDHRRRERKMLRGSVVVCGLLLIAVMAVYLKGQGAIHILSGGGKAPAAVMATETPVVTPFRTPEPATASEAAVTQKIIPAKTQDKTPAPAKRSSAPKKRSSSDSKKKKVKKASSSVRKTAAPVRHETTTSTGKTTAKAQKTAAPKRSGSNSSKDPKMDGSMTTDMDGDFDDYLSD